MQQFAGVIKKLGDNNGVNCKQYCVLHKLLCEFGLEVTHSLHRNYFAGMIIFIYRCVRIFGMFFVVSVAPVLTIGANALPVSPLCCQGQKGKK